MSHDHFLFIEMSSSHRLISDRRLWRKGRFRAFNMGNGSSSGRHLNVPEEELKPALYEMDPKHQKRLKKMIMDGKLAPCYRPKEDQNDDNPEECPICLLNYPCLNRSECCKQGICTECYIQVRDKKVIESCRNCGMDDNQKILQVVLWLQSGTRERDSKVACPFCKKEPYTVKFCGALSEGEKKRIQIEEQKTREAQIRMRNEETQRDLEREQQRQSQGLDRLNSEESDTSGLNFLAIAHLPLPTLAGRPI